MKSSSSSSIMKLAGFMVGVVFFGGRVVCVRAEFWGVVGVAA